MRTNLYKTKTGGSGPHAPCGAAPRRQRLKRILALAFAICCGAQMAQAYEFSATVDYKTLYFNIIDPNNRYVEVTYPGTSSDPWPDGITKPINSLFINGTNTVTHEGTEYYIRRIGAYAFKGCTGLWGVTIPSSVQEMSGAAFDGCTGIQQVTINSPAVASEDRYSWLNFGTIFGSQVTRYTIGSAVTRIGKSAFYDCSGMEEITIGSGVASVGSEAFSNCNSLQKVNISNLTAWCQIDFADRGSNPLRYAHHLYCNSTLVTDLSGVGSPTAIKKYAFSGCTDLTSANIPNSVTRIGSYAFEGCTGLWGVTIPSSVQEMSSKAFDGCTGIQQVTINSPAVASEDRSIGTNFGTIFGRQVKRYTIGSAVTRIGNYAFYDCSGMEEITIGSGVASVGSYAFSHNCNSLQKVNISNLTAWCQIGFADSGSNPLSFAHHLYCNSTLVTDLSGVGSPAAIKAYAFSGCTDLTSANIPNSVTRIGASAFDGCTGLWGVTIPSFVQEMSSNAFDGCTGIQQVTINSPAVASKDRSIGTNFGTIFGRQVKRYTIGSAVTRIGNYAFYDCSGMEEITIGSGVASVGLVAFSHNCNSLQKVNISNLTAWCQIGFTDSGSNPLSFAHHLYCNSTLVTDLSGVGSPTAIKAYAFSGCTDLTSANIPNSVTRIGASAFDGCTGLWGVTIPSSVQEMSSKAFDGCTGIQQVTINSPAVASEGRSFGTNFGTIFGRQVKRYTIGSAVTRIGNYAFYNCSGMVEMLVNALVPPTIAAHETFWGVPKSMPVYVPFASVQSYKEAYGWKDFFNIGPFPTAMPYSQGFASTTIPGGWGRYEGQLQWDGESGTGTATLTESGTWHFGQNYVFNSSHAFTNIGQSDNQHHWLVSPTIAIDDIDDAYLSVSLAMTRPTGAPVTPGKQDHQAFGIYVTDNGGATWHKLRTFANEGGDLPFEASLTATGRSSAYSLADFKGKNIKIGFYASCTDAGDNINRLHLDNVSVRQVAGMNQPPASVVASEVGGHSAKVSWYGHLNLQTEWDVWVTEYGATPSASFDFNPSYGHFAHLTTFGNVWEVLDLLPNREYEAWVRYNDGHVKSEWRKSQAFTTVALCNEPANVQVETTTTTIFVSWEPGQANQTRWQVSIIGSDVWDYQTNETSILIDAHEMFLPGESFSVVVTGYCEDGDGDVESETIQATMQPLPSLTLNETTDVNYCVVINGHETGRGYGSTQFILSAEMLSEMQSSTISELNFYSANVQNGRPWGNNARFEVYMKEVDFVDFEDYCGGFYDWDDMSLFYSGPLSLYDGVMNIEASYLRRFAYRNGNLLVGIKQTVAGTDCAVQWYAEETSNPDASMYDISDRNPVCHPYVPQVSFVYEPDPYQPPTNLAAAFVSPNEVYYSWTPRPGQTATIIAIANDASFSSLISSTNSTDTDCTATFGTSLQPATTYYVRAKALFDDDLGVTHESEWSATIELVVPGICDAPTGLAASNVGPFSANLRWTGDADGYEVEYDRLVGEVLSTTWEQDFEIIASGNLPSGWSTITPPTVNSQKWRVVNATKNQMANGGRGGAIISAKQANAATDDYLLIPVSDLRGRLSFYAKFRNQTGPGTGVVAIYYTKKKTNPQPTDLTPIEAKTITDTYTEYVIDLGHLQGGGYIAFRHYAPSNANVYAICLDDIEMENYGPQYGAWVSGGITDWNGTTLEGLTPDNTYRARVRALCDGSYSGHSAWTNATVFSTVKNIEFYDPDVEALCVAAWDTDDDGKLSYAEAAAVTSLGEVFKRKTDVDMFGELQYFTGLSAIGDHAFYNCTNLSGVSLPPQITSIGEYAFGYCKGMTGITLPENVNTIDMCAFRGSGLNNVYLPNSVTHLSNFAYAECNNLESVYLPTTVTSMDANPFAGCKNLASIVVDPANTAFDSRNNCNAIIHTGTNKLVSGCQYTVIPETVAIIGSNSFQMQDNSNTITIPASVNAIEPAAFYGCSNLSYVTVLATEPPALGTLAFDGVTEGCWFAVPCEHLAAYRAHEQWGLLNIGNDCDYRFVTDGKWNDANNWLYGELPGEDDDVTIEANCLLDTDVTVASINFLNTGANIPNNGALEIDGCTLTVTNTIANSDANRLVLNDGAQLKHNNIGVRATVYKSITGYGAANVNKSTGWHFIASPIYGGVYANRVDNLIANPAENYDLYAFVPEWEKEWDNLKDNYNSGYVNSMQGYLYANLNNVSLGFKGTLMKSNAKLNMSINETDPETGEAMDYSEYSFGAWRLLGNSFVCDAYITDASDEGIAYYVMNEEGDGYIPAEGAIAPMQGFFVEVPTKTESYSFYLSREAPTGGRAATLNANLSKAKATRDDVSAGSKTVIDRAIVHFGEGSTLEKLTFRDDNTRLYIPMDGTDYAVVKAGTMGELPVNFKAETNGRYTLDFTNEEVAFSYLRLIDNMTGTETDLLQQPYYSFDARTTDYASRFRLQFATGTSENAEGSTFGFVNASGNFTVFGIEGEATLQVIDVTGRVLSSETFSGSYERKLDVSPGVYLMRLINGADVKTQKIVIE